MKITGTSEDGLYPILEFTTTPEGWKIIPKDDEYDWVVNTSKGVLGVRKVLGQSQSREAATGDSRPIIPLVALAGALAMILLALSIILRRRKNMHN